MNVPEGLKYTKDHEWIRVEGEMAVVGITDFAQSELGDIVFVEINSLGESLDKGEVFGTIEAVKTVSDIFLPVGGEITEVNPLLEEKPEVVNEDPYGKGWLIKIKILEPSAVDALMDGASYQQMINA